MLFSQVLLYISLLLFPLFVLLLTLSDKYDRDENGGIRDIIPKKAKLFFLIEGLSFLFIVQTNVSKLSVEYKVLIILIVAFLIFSLVRCKSRRTYFSFFIAVVLYHIFFLYNPPFPIIFIDERFELIAYMTNLGRLSSDIQLTAHYAPFPMGLFIFYVLSSIFGIEVIFLNYWMWATLFIFVYDLIMFLLIKKITNNWKAALLGILILAMTPPANITSNPYRWLANLLIIICIYVIFRQARISISSIALLVIAYTAAIFTHPSAIMAIIFLGLILLISILLGFQNSNKVNIPTLIKVNKLFSIFLLFLILTIVRSIYTRHYIKEVYSVSSNLLEDLITLFTFGKPEASPYLSPFLRNIDPINAYSWSMMVVISTAYVFYSAVNCKLKDFIQPLFLYFTGAYTIIMGWIAGGNISTAAYAGFSLLTPVAGCYLNKVLKARRVKYVVAILTLLCAFISINDPMITRELYVKMGAQDIHAKVEDLAVSRTLLLFASGSKSFQSLLPYEIATSIDYLFAREGCHSPFISSIKGADKLRQTLDATINYGHIPEDDLIIWVSRWFFDIRQRINASDINIYYDCGKYIMFSARATV